jgi:hypothetical protein
VDINYYSSDELRENLSAKWKNEEIFPGIITEEQSFLTVKCYFRPTQLYLVWLQDKQNQEYYAVWQFYRRLLPVIAGSEINDNS